MTRDTSATVKAQIAAYLAALPPDARRVLRIVRTIVRTVAPTATEHFSYGVPGFKIDGQPLVWYAAFTKHFSLYPMGSAIRNRYASALRGHPTSAGTIRFSLADPVPQALVAKLVKARAVEARAEARKKLKR